jgi:tRNA1(Val) A37 N6-methylase TrmN6
MHRTDGDDRTTRMSMRTTEDAVLDGRLILRQPRCGHRVGHDAILLAAATRAQPGDQAVDLGAGVGAAGLALARRIERLTVALVEIDPTLTTLAAENIGRNGLADHVRAVCLDVGASATAFANVGLVAGEADCVLMNPPFNALQNPSPNVDRRMAHAASQGALEQWVRTAARLLRPSGTLTLIWRADGLADVLAALASEFGAVSLLPIYGKPASPAIRILLSAVKSSRAPLALRPGLLLADEHGRPTAEAEAVLRGGASLLGA